MKKILATLLLLAAWVSVSFAQECPPEWVKYTMGTQYLYDIQHDRNEKDMTETGFKEYLLETAKRQLAQKVEVQVRAQSSSEKSAINGRTSSSYTSSTQLSTDVNLELVDTKTLYNAAKKEGWAIVYIDKEHAKSFYKNKVEQVISKAQKAVDMINTYIEGGFKEKTSGEAKAALEPFKELPTYFFWLNFFYMPQDELSALTERCNKMENTLKQLAAESQHSLVVFISCNADLFGSPYPTLKNEIKGKLKDLDCSFTENPNDADWVIDLNASTREYNTMATGGVTSYFAYAEAQLTVVKVATRQRIYEDEISIKGAHTRSMQEAGRTAYKDLTKKLSGIIVSSIKDL